MTPTSSEVEYSHNPNNVTDHQKTPGDTTYVYVGKFTLTKTDTNNVPLAGAMFHIKDAKSNIVKFVKVNDNEYRVADSTEPLPQAPTSPPPIRTMASSP